MRINNIERLPVDRLTKSQHDATLAASKSKSGKVAGTDEIAEGGRNNALTRIAGSLRARGLSSDAIETELQAINRLRCRPPLEESEVAGIAASIGRYPVPLTTAPLPYESSKVLLDDWNERFAVVSIGGKVFVAESTPDGFEFYPPAQFTLFYQPVKVWVRGESKPMLKDATKIWLDHPRRRQYRRALFRPGGNTGEDVLNLWRGFAVEAREGRCELFLSHVRDNICSGDPSLYEFVLGWLAQLFQAPMTKLGTALVLRGKQGTGKTFFGKTIGHLLGGHYQIVSQPRHVTGHFNRHIEGSLLLEAEEAFWAGDKEAEGALKHLITSDVVLIERKGVDAYEAMNYTRVLITSNADWIVPAGLEERRFAVLDVGDGRMQDSRYFAAIQEQLSHGGYEALLHFLRNRSYDEHALRHPPRTAALDQQKIASLNTEQGWLLDTLERGLLPGDVKGVGESPSEMLRDDYIRHGQRVGRSHRAIETLLGTFLRKAIPGLRKRRGEFVTHDGTVIEGVIWMFPPLAETRSIFRKHLGLALIRDDAEKASWSCAPDPRNRDTTM